MIRRRMQKSDPPNQQQSVWMTVSDLMASLLFLFLLILTLFSIQFKQEQQAFTEATKALTSPHLTREKILKDLKQRLQHHEFAVDIDAKEGILRISDQGLSFPPAKALPERHNIGNIGKLANALQDVLPCFAQQRKPRHQSKQTPAWCGLSSANLQAYACPKSYQGQIDTIMIEGHTDASQVRAGVGYRDNLSLSAARATTVLRLLKLCSPGLAKIINSRSQPILAASGYSYLRPIYPQNPYDKRNRRIDIRFVMEPPTNILSLRELKP